MTQGRKARPRPATAKPKPQTIYLSESDRRWLIEVHGGITAGIRSLIRAVAGPEKE